MEDQDFIDSTMDGKPYKAARLAATLRRHLWKEHLGLLPAQSPDECNDPNAQPPDFCLNATTEGPENNLVEDPLGDELWEIWTERATVNTEIYRSLFHADPDDTIKTFEDYNRFRPWGEYREGHVFDSEIPVADVKRKLDEIRGHLVWMPLGFLEDAEMAESGLTINRITEVGTYILLVLSCWCCMCMSVLTYITTEYIYIVRDVRRTAIGTYLYRLVISSFGCHILPLLLQGIFEAQQPEILYSPYGVQAG